MANDGTDLLRMVLTEIRQLRTETQTGISRIHDRVDSESRQRLRLSEKVEKNTVSVAKVQVKTSVMSTVIGAIAGALAGLGMR